jgi:hypothetical protein
MKNPLIHLLALTASAMLHGESPRGVRTWTDTTGRTLQAALHGFDSGQVALQFPDGKITLGGRSRIHHAPHRRGL